MIVTVRQMVQNVSEALTYDYQSTDAQMLMAISMPRDRVQMAHTCTLHCHLMTRLNKCKTEVTKDDDVKDRVSKSYTSLNCWYKCRQIARPNRICKKMVTW